MTKEWDPNEFGDSGSVEASGDVQPWDASEFSDEDEGKKKSKKTLEKGSLKDQAQDIASFGTAAVDLITGLPGMVGGALGTGAGMVAQGLGIEDSPMQKDPAAQILQGIQEGGERSMVSNVIPGLQDHQDRPGYRAAMKPVEAITEGIHAVGKGVGKTAEFFGASPEAGAELAAGTEIGAMAALPFARRAPAKPGTPRAYDEVQQRRGSMSDAQIEAARKSYTDAEAKMWDPAEWKTDYLDLPPREYAAAGVEDTSLRFEPPQGGIRRQDGPGYVASPPELGRILEEGERPRMEAVDATRPAPRPLDAATTELSMSESLPGKRDKTPVEDFAQNRDRSTVEYQQSAQMVDPFDPLTAAREEQSRIGRGPAGNEPLGHYEAGELAQKPRLKAELPYEYEGALPFESVKAEPYKPDTKKGYNALDTLRQLQEKAASETATPRDKFVAKAFEERLRAESEAAGEAAVQKRISEMENTKATKRDPTDPDVQWFESNYGRRVDMADLEGFELQAEAAVRQREKHIKEDSENIERARARGKLDTVRGLEENVKFYQEDLAKRQDKLNRLRRIREKYDPNVKKADAEALRERDLNEIFNSWNDNLNRAVLKALRDKNADPRIILEAIRDHSETPWMRDVAKKMLSDENFRVDIEVTSGSKNPAEYNLNQHRIRLWSGVTGSDYIILHEMTHARTSGFIRAYEMAKAGVDRQFKRLPEDVQAAIKRLDEVLGEMKKDERFSGEYALEDMHELIAEAYSNPEFRAKAGEILLPDSLKGTKGWRYYWDAIVGTLGEMLGFKTRKEQTYLSELMSIGDVLMQPDKIGARIHYADMMRTDDPLVFGARLKKGVAEAMQDVAREFSVRENAAQPIDKIVADVKKHKIEDLRDLNDKDGGILHQISSYVKKLGLQDTTLRRVLSNSKGTGEFVKWTVDNVALLERKTTMATKAAVEGALTDFRKHFHNKSLRPQMQEMWTKWQENIGVRDLSRADFATDLQWNTYMKIRAQDDLLLQRMNEMRESAGLKPIQRIPSHFRSFWEGDYRVQIYDANGTKKSAFGFKTRQGAQHAVREFRKEHPNMRVEWDHIKTDVSGIRSLDAFEEAIKVMGDINDPVTNALKATFNKILQTRGYGRTAIHRKGILGFLGSEGGTKGLRNMDRALEQHFTAGYRYIGNLEKQKVLAELQKVPVDIRKKLPNTFDWLYSYIRKAQGAKLGEHWVDSLITNTARAVGLGEHAPINAVRGISAVATTYWLFTGRFILSQFPQSAYIWPKLIQQVGIKEATAAYADGLMRTTHIKKRDALTNEAIDWASDKGYLDPTIKNLVSKGFDEVPASGRLDTFREITSKPAAMVEHHAVRLPAFLAAEKALRPYTRDKFKRFEQAAEMADDYMVNYGRTHAPMAYDKTGLLGEFARPLKQFAHNQWGQFIEYAQGLKNKGEVAPLAGFLGVQASMAGLKGVILVTEATVLVNFLNWAFDLDIPTPEQLMLKHGVHDALVFGGLSTVLQHDISSSVAAPGLPQLFTFVPISFTGKIAQDLGTYAVALAKGELTDQIRLRAAMAVTPNIFHQLLINIYTPEGMPTANPGNKDLKGNYRRDEIDRWTAPLIGAKPLDEAKADALQRAVKEDLARDLQKRMNALDAIVDRARNGQPIDSYLFKRYIEEGGDPSRLSASIVRRLKERVLTGPERELDSPRPSITQQHRIKELMDYLNSQVPDTGEPRRFDPETGEIVPEKISDGQKPLFTGQERIYSDTNPPPSWADRVPPKGYQGDEEMMHQEGRPEFDRLNDPFQTDDWPMIRNPDENRDRKLKTRPPLRYKT